MVVMIIKQVVKEFFGKRLHPVLSPSCHKWIHMILTPIYYVLPWAHVSYLPNCILISLAIFVGLTDVTDRQTDRATLFVAIGCHC